MSECECGCVYVNDDYQSNILQEKIVKARKEHKCMECGDIIYKGDSYEYVFGTSEGDPFTSKTCSTCIELRYEFFCGAWTYQYMYEDLRNHIESIDGEISSECILRLSEKARDRVFDIIERFWDLKHFLDY